MLRWWSVFRVVKVGRMGEGASRASEQTSGPADGALAGASGRSALVPDGQHCPAPELRSPGEHREPKHDRAARATKRESKRCSGTRSSPRANVATS